MSAPMSDDTTKFFCVGAIETVSGATFNVIDPTPEMVHLSDVAHSLSMICRYNGHVPSFYSVAEHSVRVAAWLAEAGHSPEVCLTGLLHDASEAYVGDMIRPLKRLEGLGSLHQEHEERVATVVHQALGGTYPHPDVVHDADRAIYEWEVEQIRTGLTVGMLPGEAKALFTNVFIELKERCE